MDDLLQDICLFAENIVCDLLPQRQDTLQPIQKGRWHLVIFVLFLQELSSQVLSSVLDTLAVSTDLKRDAGKAEDRLCDRIQLESVNLWLIAIWEN